MPNRDTLEDWAESARSTEARTAYHEALALVRTRGVEDAVKELTARAEGCESTNPERHAALIRSVALFSRNLHATPHQENTLHA